MLSQNMKRVVRLLSSKYDGPELNGSDVARMIHVDCKSFSRWTSGRHIPPISVVDDLVGLIVNTSRITFLSYESGGKGRNRRMFDVQSK